MSTKVKNHLSYKTVILLYHLVASPQWGYILLAKLEPRCRFFRPFSLFLFAETRKYLLVIFLRNNSLELERDVPNWLHKHLNCLIRNNFNFYKINFKFFRKRTLITVMLIPFLNTSKNDRFLLFFRSMYLIRRRVLAPHAQKV